MEKKNKPNIGVICRAQTNSTERYLFPALKRKFNVVLFPIQEDIDYGWIKEQAKNIKLVINTAGDVPNTEDSLEMVKTLEGLGRHVIDSSRSNYYKEDKWLFYLTCIKHNLPTPKTYYIPRNISLSKGRLREILDEGGVVFKGVFSDTGRAVKRAMNYKEALRAIKNLRKKIGSMPMIAQLYVPHGKVSYRVTLAGDRIIQAIVKYGRTWKEGKLFWKNEKYRIFKVDKNVVRLCKKTARVFGIEWCGIDLMRDTNGKWYIIEVNSCPSMDFVIKDAKRAVEELVNYFIHLQRIS